MHKSKPTHKVVAAVVIRDGKVLCAKRGKQAKTLAGFWEFPGGKIESGESCKEALEREIKEECSFQIEVGRLITTTTYDYEFAQIILTSFYAKLCVETQEPLLVDHDEILWIAPKSLESLNWAPADRETVDIVQRDFRDQ